MTSESWDGEMVAPPDWVAYCAYRWFRDFGEWPTPGQLHAHLANRFRCPVEVASFDTLNALDKQHVYGLPSIVAMRLGEAVGDWQAPLPDWDNGFRIAVPDDEQPAMQRHYDRWRGAVA